MIVPRFITAVHALVLINLIVASEAKKLEINKHKQDALLTVYLSNDQDDLSISNSEKMSILGYRETDDIPKTSTLLKTHGIGILHKHELFSLFDLRHMDEVQKTFDLLLASTTYDNFIQRATVLKEHVNRNLWMYAVQKALLYRHDTDDVQAPPLWQVSARSFFTNEAIVAAIKNTASRAISSYDIPISTAGILRDPESQFSWFREDLRMNAMHYLTSMIFLSGNGVAGGVAGQESKAMSGLNRMKLPEQAYEQLMNRYQAARQVANMAEVQPLDIEEVIMEGYDSHLATPSGDTMFAPRPSGMKPQNVIRMGKRYTIAELKTVKRRAADAVTTGLMMKNDGTYTETTALNLLRAITGFYDNEPLDQVYGEGFHMYEHTILSAITDPEGKYGQNLGVLGVAETAMRDPLFYRLHAEKNEIASFYESLQPYSETAFGFPGVEVTDAEVIATKINSYEDVNVLTTYLETVTVDVQYDSSVAALIQGDPAPVMVGVEQLNHESFMYRIGVTNRNAVPVSATVRILMAPSVDQRTGKPFKSLLEQRTHFFVMDKFQVNLHRGENVIERLDEDSATASPSMLSVEDLKTEGMMRDQYAGCLWPRNLLLPLGSADGAEFDVFILLTDWSRDQEVPTEKSNRGPNPCGGMSDNDRHVLNYPFERKITQGVADYLVGKAKNAFVVKVNIMHDDGKR